VYDRLGADEAVLGAINFECPPCRGVGKGAVDAGFSTANADIEAKAKENSKELW
jgi:hypothetical protein